MIPSAMLDATCSMLLLPLLPALVTTRGGGVLPRLPLVTEDSVDVMRKSTPLAWRLLAGLGLGLPGLCGRGRPVEGRLAVGGVRRRRLVNDDLLSGLRYDATQHTTPRHRRLLR